MRYSKSKRLIQIRKKIENVLYVLKVVKTMPELEEYDNYMANLYDTFKDINKTNIAVNYWKVD